MSNKESEMTEFLNTLSEYEARQLQVMIHWREQDAMEEKRRRSAIDVTRGEFEDLAKRINQEKTT